MARTLGIIGGIIGGLWILISILFLLGLTDSTEGAVRLLRDGAPAIIGVTSMCILIGAALGAIIGTIWKVVSPKTPGIEVVAEPAAPETSKNKITPPKPPRPPIENETLT